MAKDELNCKVSRATFERLQRHAEPIVDTIDTVINRALDALDRLQDRAAAAKPPSAGAAKPERLNPAPPDRRGDRRGEPVRRSSVAARGRARQRMAALPYKLPDLTHSKVLRASIDHEAVIDPNWNALYRWFVERVMLLVSDFDEIRRIFRGNIVRGQRTDKNFKPLPSVDLSVQDLKARRAGPDLVAGARRLGVALDISFEWRSKKGALHPGERRRIEVDSDGHVRMSQPSAAGAAFKAPTPRR